MARYASRKASLGMDLTKTYPRSPREKLAGLFMLARTTDKARAYNAGTPGPYHFGCGMDKHVLGFLGSDPEEFAKVVAARGDEGSIGAWAHAHLQGKSAGDIESFNADFAQDAPEPNSDSEGFYKGEQERLGRPDIRTWFDLLDADEGRPVPQTSAV